MNEKHKKEKHKKSKSHERKSKCRSPSPSQSSDSQSDEWVEKTRKPTNSDTQREDWMSMTGMMKTYTKNDIRTKREEKDKKNIDSYNPATSCRELNPYWKDGGSGLPQTPDSFRKSKPFIKPTNDDNDYYSKSSKPNIAATYSNRPTKSFMRPGDDKNYSGARLESSSNHNRQEYFDKEKDYKNRSYDRGSYRTSSNWRKQSENKDRSNIKTDKKNDHSQQPKAKSCEVISLPLPKDNKYLSDEKMNKLAAKIVKAEIVGDTTLVKELQAKLEAAREYRKQHPEIAKEEDDDRVMLITTSSSGNSRPIASCDKGDPRSKSGKRKSETHVSGERMKYFGNDDKYNLKQMFEEEKYGSNYNDQAELAKIASKHKNPNDDLEDIFMDEITKNRTAAKDSEIEKQRAINQHVRMEKTLEGCHLCMDSRNMLKHLMVSIANKVYLSLPARQSLVRNHCIISTIQHSPCVTALDEDVWEEILNYRRALTQFYDSQNMDVIFFETAINLQKYPHMSINCVPLPRDVGDMAAIYFKKAILECEAEWSMNKKVIDLRGRNIRRGVPKGLPYFWIDFGMDPGFAHVIEDQRLFSKTFAEEIVAGILDLDHSLWKNPHREQGDTQRMKVLDFIKEWKPFEPTKSDIINKLK